MEKLRELIEIQQELKESGNANLSKILSTILKRQWEKEAHIIGVIGDELVGKSTIINSVLGENFLPTTVIPSIAETTIMYGDENKIYNGNGSPIENGDLPQLLEEKGDISISINSEFLKSNSLVIKEFHGLLNKSKLKDMNLMAEVYRCDAVILVMTAEHLLSESESAFIEK